MYCVKEDNMINPGRVVDILSFSLSEDFPIAGTDVVVKAGNNTITRKGGTYRVTNSYKQGEYYGEFPIDSGYLLFCRLSGKLSDLEPTDER